MNPLFLSVSLTLPGPPLSLLLLPPAPHKYKTLWEAVENEDTLAVQSLLSRDHTSYGGRGGVGASLWERGERKERDWERERVKGVNRMSEQGLVPLDVAALTHNSPLLHVLTKGGARHNPVCKSHKIPKVTKTSVVEWCHKSVVQCKSYSDLVFPLSVPPDRVGS